MKGIGYDKYFMKCISNDFFLHELSLPEDNDIIWTRAWADEVWTGAITPLMWSVRGRWMRDGGSANYRHFEMGELAELRMYKYHHGTVYYDTSDFLFFQFLKKKENGTWEKPSQKEGKRLPLMNNG